MLELIPDDMDPAWPLSFDWVQAGPEAYDAAQLSVALCTVMQRRLGMREQVRSTEETRQFGRYIQALRESRRWSYPQLAEQANLHPLAVALLEVAALTEAELSAVLVSRIAMAFGKTIGELDVNPLAVLQPVPDSQPFGAWLRQHLQRLAGYAQALPGTSPPTWAETQALYRRDTTPHEATRSLDRLVHSLRLPSQHIALPDGHDATATLSLDPAEIEDGPLLLRIWVEDEQDTPLEGIRLAMDLDGRRYQAQHPTDDQGSTVITLTLDHVLQTSTFHLVAHRAPEAPSARWAT